MTSVELKVARNISHEEGRRLLNFIMSMADSVELCRQISYDLDDSTLDKVNKEWEDFVIEEDAKRRKRYQEDQEYREIFDNFKPKNVEVSEIFDVLLRANLAITKAEERVDEFFFVDPNEDFKLTAKDFEIDFVDSPELAKLSEELSNKDKSKYDEDLSETEGISEVETYCIPYKDENNSSMSVRHSRLNIDGSGPIYEFVKFNLNNLKFKEQLESALEESLFKEPISIDMFAFKSPLFYIDNRPIMNISTENQEIILKLNADELEKFKELKIDYINIT